MKKIILLSVVAVAVTSASCRKTRTCDCHTTTTTTYNGITTTSTTEDKVTTEKQKKGDFKMRENCFSTSNTNTFTGGTMVTETTCDLS